MGGVPLLYAYDNETGGLLECQPTEFKKQRIMERSVMEKWVEKDPSILGEELLVITTEFAGFDKTAERLDVLALDTSGNLVVVELKRDDSGKNVDLQALKYAAYCSVLTLSEIAHIYAEYQSRKGVQVSNEEAEKQIRGFITDDSIEELGDTPRIMLVAREYRNEVTASVKWLRDKYGLDITCIKWDVYEMPDGKVVVDTSTLIPQPETRDFEMRVNLKERAQPTARIIAMNEFFIRCTDLLSQRIPMDYMPPNNNPYYMIPAGIPNVHFEWGFYGRPRTLGVEVHFEQNTMERNLAAFAICEPHLPALAEAFGQSVGVENPWHSKWVRFYIERQGDQMDEDLAIWAANNMATLIRVIQPVLGEIETD